MNTSQASIEERITLDLTHDPYMRVYKIRVSLDEQILHQAEKFDRDDAWVYASSWVRKFLKEWPTCQDQTSTLEPKYRTTVTSSNGLVTVRKSLY